MKNKARLFLYLLPASSGRQGGQGITAKKIE